MRFACLLFAAAAALAGQQPAVDLPRVDVLDFYGRRTVSKELIIQALGLREGSLLPASKGDAEERINQIDAVVASHLEAVCCPQGKTVLYVGVEERGAPHYDLRPPPGGAGVLPEPVITAYQQLTGPGGGGSAGRAAFTAAAQAYMADNADLVRGVLRDSGDELHRAAAAEIVASVNPDAQSVDDLQFALHDADPTVRSIAIQGLVAFAMLDQADPARRLRVSTTWFMDLLDSLAWSDRMEAASALETLTAAGDSFTISRLRTRALDTLIEMARWKTAEHAKPAFVLLGRIAALPEADIEAAWKRGDRESVIAAASKRTP